MIGPTLAPPSDADVAFWTFHRKHPEVYDALARLARQGVRAGKTKLGIGMLYEVVRWERIIARLPARDEQWKLNNNYRSRYARLIMEEPGLAGIFDVRRITT